MKIEETKEVCDQIDAVATRVRNIPCTMLGRTCFQVEEEAAKKKNGNFHAYRPQEMCDACAAYWHLSCALARLIWWSKRQ